MKILKWIFIVIVILGLTGFVTYLILDEPLPQGKEGEKAEMLADQMLNAVNDSAWEATTIIHWNYVGMHEFTWYKKNNWVKVSWDDYEVYYKLHDKNGVAFAKGKKIKKNELTQKLIDDAHSYWINDAFWLNPITKIRDQGTSRKYVDLNQNLEGLLVTYNSGGMTPGDSYLYLINPKSGMPEAIKMWVSIIPVGGIKFTWDGWQTTYNGAKVSTYHEGPIEVKISNFKSWPSMSNHPEPELFSPLENL